MFKRSLIHVDGPPGAGKTAFIEAVLAGNRRRYEGSFAAVRARHDESAVKPRVRTVDDDDPMDVEDLGPELRRFLAAGTTYVMDYRFNEPNADAFFMSDVGHELWDVALIEGAEPTGYPDLVVYVLPASVGPLLRRHRFEDEAERLAGLMADAGLPKDLFLRLTDAGDLPVEAQRIRPPATEHWTLADEHRGLVRAKLVVVNVRNHDERGRAEALLAEVARLRRDPEVFDDLAISLIDGRTPITAVAANLTDADDPGTRRALARIRRAFPSIE